MTMQEMALEYLASAEKLDARIEELNAAIRETREPSRLLKLNRRLCLLREMRLETRSIGLRLKNYYKEDPHGKTDDTL